MQHAENFIYLFVIILLCYWLLPKMFWNDIVNIDNIGTLFVDINNLEFNF